MEQIKKYKLEDRILMFGRYPVDYMPSFFAKADVMLASLKDEKIFNLTVPAKIQAYMSVSKPIVAMMNGAGNEIIKNANCGISVPAGSSNALIDALKQLKGMPKEQRVQLGHNGYIYCKQNFDKETCLNKLYELLVDKKE